MWNALELPGGVGQGRYAGVIQAKNGLFNIGKNMLM